MAVFTLYTPRKEEKTAYFHSLTEFGMKILLATEKPFAKGAVEGIEDIVRKSGSELVKLESYADKSELLAAVADVDAIIIRSDKITAEVVAAAPNLKIVVRAGAGYDNVDLDACSARGIVVMNTPGQNSNAVAELVIGMMIFMARSEFLPGTGSEILGKTLGIHAYGHVGRLVALKGKALGMTVYAYDPYIADKSIFAQDGVVEVNSVEELYKNSNYISIHIPATEQTIRSINYDLLMSVPSGATIVNTARKEVIDEPGLLKVLVKRKDLKYASDVAPNNQEELDRFGIRVFLTTKKMGAETAEANLNAGLAAANQVVDFFKTGNVKFQVNR